MPTSFPRTSGRHLAYSAIVATPADLAARGVVSLGDSPDIDIVQVPSRARSAAASGLDGAGPLVGGRSGPGS